MASRQRLTGQVIYQHASFGSHRCQCITTHLFQELCIAVTAWMLCCFDEELEILSSLINRPTSLLISQHESVVDAACRCHVGQKRADRATVALVTFDQVAQFGIVLDRGYPSRPTCDPQRLVR